MSISREQALAMFHQRYPQGSVNSVRSPILCLIIALFMSQPNL
jgi:hypothetical protein